MKINLSYLTIELKFKDIDDYGLWTPPDTIRIQKGLKGQLLVDTIQHEIGHVGYFLFAPRGEESQVRVKSTLWTEALHRNRNLRQLVERNLC